MRNLDATFTLTVIVFLKCIPFIDGKIQCYKCLVAIPSHYTNETIRLCKDFDYSDKFVVNCPYSTFCMKRITSANIPDLINGTERDCANQKFETQKYSVQDKAWHPEVTIEEPYKEGCAKVNDKGARTTTTEFCYCKDDLCNSTTKSYCSQFLNMSAVIILLLRYIFWDLIV